MTAKIAQINNTILQRVIAIGLDPAAPTALHPVITRACNAAIIVVVFDSVAMAPSEHGRYASFAGHGTGPATEGGGGAHGNRNVVVARHRGHRIRHDQHQHIPG